jgi:hypothetical protein
MYAELISVVWNYICIIIIIIIIITIIIIIQTQGLDSTRPFRCSEDSIRKTEF